MAMHVDDARRDVAPAGIDHRRSFGRTKLRPADRLNLAAHQQHRAIVDPPALAIENGRAADQGWDSAIRSIGRRKWILVDPDRAWLGRRGGGATGHHKDCQQRSQAPSHAYFTPCIRYFSGQLSNSRTAPMPTEI